MLNSLQKLKQKFNHVLYQSPKKKKSQNKTRSVRSPTCSLPTQMHQLIPKKIHKTMFFEKYIYI